MSRKRFPIVTVKNDHMGMSKGRYGSNAPLPASRPAKLAAHAEGRELGGDVRLERAIQIAP